MKICPTCRRTYTDDGLNFCLDDGTVLTVSDPNPSQEATLVMNHPRPTERQVSPAPTQPAVQTNWNAPTQAPYSMQPAKKSSKTWLWVVGIFAVLILLCGVGGVGFLALIASQQDGASNTLNTTTNKSSDNRKSSPSPADEKTSASPNPSPFDSSAATPIDLAPWVQGANNWGSTAMNGDEFVMSSKDRGYYYVIVSADDYRTDGATTRVTVRNIDNEDTNLGYGLVFHSDITPVNRDYGFLIDTKRRRYRVVRHEPSKETTVQGWTSAPLIKSGTEENVLEARDKGDTVELYINGTLVTSIKNTLTPKGGVPGLYSGDGIDVGFKNLQIAK
jgi:hypothetical protein